MKKKSKRVPNAASKALVFWGTLFILLSGTLPEAVGLQIVVKEGDTLSKLIAAHVGKPLYGKHGKLQEILSKNPTIKNPDRIFPGEHIVLEDEETPSRQTAAQELPVIQENTPATPQVPHRYGIFSITPEFSSTKIRATDRTTGDKAEFVSNSNYGATMQYSHIWNSSFQTDFFWGLSKVSLKEPSSGGTLENSNPTLYSFGARIRYQPTTKFSLSAGLGLYQRPYLRGISSTAVGIDSRYIPHVDAMIAYDFAQFTPFGMGASIGSGVDFPTRESFYKTHTNLNYRASVYVRHDVNTHVQTEAGLKAGYLKENTSIAKQSQSDFGVYLRLSFRFGEEQKQ